MWWSKVKEFELSTHLPYYMLDEDVYMQLKNKLISFNREQAQWFAEKHEFRDGYKTVLTLVSLSEKDGKLGWIATCSCGAKEVCDHIKFSYTRSMQFYYVLNQFCDECKMGIYELDMFKDLRDFYNVSHKYPVLTLCINCQIPHVQWEKGAERFGFSELERKWI
jgi:hypothetical protein